MGERPGISKGELEIVRLVWELKSASVRQVHEALPAERSADFATVQTYLRRLESKGYLKGRLEGRTRIYSPRVQPRTVIRETINDLVDRLFGGEALPLVRHLIEDRGITGEDLEGLKQLIDRLEENRHD